MIRVRTPRRGTEPHLVIEALRNRIDLRVDASRPAKLPAETLPSAKRAFDRTLTKHSRLHDLADRLNRRPKAVKRPLKAKPGVEAEDPLLRLNNLHHALAFPHRASHRLLAPNVLAGIGGHDGLHCMPVRRRANMNDIDILVRQQLHEVPIRLDLAPAHLLGAVESGGNTVVKRIAESNQPRAPERQMIVRMRDTAEADQRARKLIGRRSSAPQHLSRNQIERPDCRRTFKEFSSGVFHKINSILSSTSTLFTTP